jgi:hypothetical protein
MRSQAIEESDRARGVGHADVHMCGQSGFAPHEHAHRVADVPVTGMRRQHRVACHGARMRARDGSAQASRGQGARYPVAKLSELGDRVANPTVYARGNLHHRRVRLDSHAVAQVGRQRGEDLVRAE